MEFIDEHPVISHRIRFADRSDIDDADAVHVRDGAVILWIVEAVCQPPSYSKDGDGRCRFNVQKVKRAGVITGDARDAAFAWLDNPQQGRLVFEAPTYPEPVLEPEPEPVAHQEATVLHPFDGAGSEIVGSIYGPTHRGETQHLLRETWGEP